MMSFVYFPGVCLPTKISVYYYNHLEISPTSIFITHYTPCSEQLDQLKDVGLVINTIIISGNKFFKTGQFVYFMNVLLLNMLLPISVDSNC